MPTHDNDNNNSKEKDNKKNNNNIIISKQVHRLRNLFSTSQLIHPYLPAEHFFNDDQNINTTTHHDDDHSCTKRVAINFTDLSAVIAQCCGAEIYGSKNNNSNTLEERKRRHFLQNKICNTTNNTPPRHLIFILCDGLGASILKNNTISSTSFLQKNNCNDVSLRAVFPSTTPAALSTFATGVWPIQHGIVGWDLKQVDKRCDFPGISKEANKNKIQIRILDKCFIDVLSGKPLSDFGYNVNDVFLEKPWAEKMRSTSDEKEEDNNHHSREMVYINAYNGDEFQNWYQRRQQDSQKVTTSRVTAPSPSQNNSQSASEFSTWQRGTTTSATSTTMSSSNANNQSLSSETITIGETEFSSIGTNEGSVNAIDYLQEGLNAAQQILSNAENNNKSTFTYIYTAHPDKHMHALGTEHEQVKNVIQGFDAAIESFWDNVRGNHKDVAMIVTADHGHITVNPEEDMIVLQDDILECLDYANIGIHGKGRHAYLHCHSGLQKTLYSRWNQNQMLCENFILLSIDEAIAEGLFGPPDDTYDLRVLQRLGDYVAIAVNNCTLVTPNEAEMFCNGNGQGSHGSLLPQEMNIPFILCKS